MWEQALQDAEFELAKARSKAKRLEIAAQVCKERIEQNAPWPGESATHN